METSPVTTLAGKTAGILERLPHFYHVEEAGGVLAALVDIFARRLERAEADMYQILRAHHVETADNTGFQGYTAPPEQRGDLDKIFALYLEALGGTALLVKINPRFTTRSLNTRRLAQLLVDETTPLISYLHKQFQLSTWKLLLRYDVEWMLFKQREILPGFALELLLGRTGVARYLRARLAPATRALLAAYDGGDTLSPGLQAALADDLNQRLLRDAGLFRLNEAEFRALNLPATVWQLINSIYYDLFRERYAVETDPAQRAQLLAVLASAEPAEIPVGADQIRLNRLLLEAAFPYDDQRPWGFKPRRVPALQDVREALVQEFNALLDAADLYDEARFPDLAEDYPYLQRRYQADPVWLNRNLLELAFPGDVEKSYVPYRERLRGLIRVLRSGASTRQGIVDIVAANLGIVGDDPQVRSAKAQIAIDEYDPQLTSFFDGQVTLYQEFEIDNTNPSEETPEIWVKMLAGSIATLCNLRFVETSTRKQVRVATRLQAGDTLVFSGSSVLLNGVAPPEMPVGAIPVLPPGQARWRFEADLIAEDAAERPAGLFDVNSYDEAVWATDEPVVRVQVLSYRYTPGTFTVVIPWHIPGFTDKFAETADHPRHQILSLVNRVKAAGILAQVAYKQIFGEDQDQEDHMALAVRGGLLGEQHETQDALWASNTQQTREDQAIADTLSLSGRFDTTSFDSLNTFAG